MQRPLILSLAVVGMTSVWTSPCLKAEESAPPPWAGNSVGLSDEVLVPWTPLTVSGDDVRLWGREYQFGTLPLPKSIITKNAEILAGPMTLLGRANGQPLEWSASVAEVRSAQPQRVCLARAATAGSLRCEGQVEIEYDGMIRCDLRLLPVSGPCPVDSLILEIPLRAEHARFLHTWPGRWGSAENSRALPRDGYCGPFKPFVWVGDHERGLAWFAESDRNMFPSASDQRIRIRQEADVVRWQVELIGRPQTVTEPLDYTFGFQATPVKPGQPDAWDYRIVHMANYGLERQPYPGQAPGGTLHGKTFLDYLAECRVRTIVFHEHWSDIQNYPQAARPEELRRLVEACHQRQIQLLVYFGYEMSNIAPEWPRYSEECLVAPRAGGYKRKPEQTAYIVCYRSQWQDFLAQGIDRIMSEFGIDGVYLDGTSEPWGCANRRHGCGYVRPDGSVAPTYPFFATRRMMKRIYTIVKDHNPAGQVNAHQSTCMTIPTLAFATSYWDGEQLQSVARGQHALKILPLDAFCTEFMGHNWGVPGELLWYGRGPFLRQEADALAFLHDIPCRPSSVADLEIYRQIWKTFDEFGRHEAVWIPYWAASDMVTTSPESVRVSLYNRPGRGFLAVLVQTGDDSCQAEIEFNLSGLGQGGSLSAQDIISQREIPLSGGQLRLPLEPLGYAVIWVKPR
jgi:hypothetical protein